MKWTDYTPLFAMILLALTLVLIVVLAVLKIETPSILGVVAATSLAALFQASATRGTAPPPPPPPPPTGGGRDEP